MNELRAGIDYCGYCKADYNAKGECNCNGFGHAKGSKGTCGYCHEDYFVAAGTDCGCDGFGNIRYGEYTDQRHARLAHVRKRHGA